MEKKGEIMDTTLILHAQLGKSHQQGWSVPTVRDTPRGLEPQTLADHQPGVSGPEKCTWCHVSVPYVMSATVWEGTADVNNIDHLSRIKRPAWELDWDPTPQRIQHLGVGTPQDIDIPWWARAKSNQTNPYPGVFTRVCVCVCVCSCVFEPLHRGSRWSWWEQSSWSGPLRSAGAGTQDWSLW